MPMIKIISAAETYDLTTLQAVKTELQISGTADDAFLSDLIRQASGQIASACNRTFAAETVRESFRVPVHDCREALGLRRYPVASVASVTHNGIPLDPEDYEVDEAAGLLYRLRGDDRIDWIGRITVEYRGGYELLAELPFEIERVCIDLIKLMYFARSRDPMLRSERVLDVIQQSFSTSGLTIGGLPADLAGRLDAYRSVPL